MDYLIIGIAAAIITALLIGIYVHLQNKKSQKNKKSKILQPVKCPVCNSSLYVGENIISKVYRPMNVPDQLCTIMGCPHCYPNCQTGIKRICPVCHKEISQEQTLTARLFNEKFGKKHVHILGCSNCRKKK